MPLNLYRRHRPDCEGGHRSDSRSGEFEERNKTWRKCACNIFASGTLAGRFKRKYTGKCDWSRPRRLPRNGKPRMHGKRPLKKLHLPRLKRTHIHS